MIVLHRLELGITDTTTGVAGILHHRHQDNRKVPRVVVDLLRNALYYEASLNGNLR